jgi:hypothetical protein
MFGQKPFNFKMQAISAIRISIPGQDECQDRVPVVQLSFVCFNAYLICYDAIKQVSKKSCSALVLSNLVFRSPQRDW